MTKRESHYRKQSAAAMERIARDKLRRRNRRQVIRRKRGYLEMLSLIDYAKGVAK